MEQRFLLRSDQREAGFPTCRSSILQCCNLTACHKCNTQGESRLGFSEMPSRLERGFKPCPRVGF